MRGRSSFARVLLGAVGALVLCGCPPDIHATRDGGTACTSNAQCNPGGPGCGVVHLCVQGFCTDTTSVLACLDGGYPEGGMSGNCSDYRQCNPPPACGLVISCIQYQCDPSAPRIFIPCDDGGTDADAGSTDAAPDIVDAGSLTDAFDGG